MLGIQINVEDVRNEKIENLSSDQSDEFRGTKKMATAMLVNSTTNNKTAEAELYSWHIPRPSLLACKPEKDHDKSSWIHHLHPYSSSRGSTSSQGSTASTHSTASGTLLLTAANLTSFAAAHPPIVTAMKSIDTASIASSTHFTVINGIGKPAIVCKKSWCARNQLTVLVCTMSLLFMIALLVGILYMEVRAREKYHYERRNIESDA